MSKFLRLSDRITDKSLGYTCLGIGFALGTTQLTLHSLFLDQYAGLFQLYQKGFEADVPEDLKTMLSKVSDDLLIPIKKPITKLLAVIGFDPMHFGSPLIRSGTIIGVPVSFFYNSKSDIDHSSILVDNKTIPWYSPDGKKLEQSLVMSDLAKKFAIAYELACAETPKLYFYTFSGPLVALVCGQINNYFCNAFALPHRPSAIKGAFYCMLTVFGLGIYFSMKDMATQYFELSAIDKVCQGGEDYIIGGIEYYEKLLEKNQALRNLLKGGNSDFKTTGDPIYLFRSKHIPPTVLKSLLEQKLNQIKQSNDSNLNLA